MTALALIVGGLLVYALLSRRLERTSITGPIVFVTIGLITSQQALGLFTLDLDAETVQILFKATLTLLLFTEASELSVKRLQRAQSIPRRLLFIAMPLVIAIGFGIAAVTFTDLGVWEAALIAAILAPTDAALGQAVVSNKRVPRDVREGLIVESGLNDGLAFPFALAFAGAASVAEGTEQLPDFFTLLIEQVGFGVLIGIAIGWIGGKVLVWAAQHDWIAAGWSNLAFVGFAVLSFAAAEMIHGNGFISAWVAGLVLGRVVAAADLHMQAFSGDLVKILVLLSFTVFGAVALAPALGDTTWAVALYALFSLALVRPVSVAISMIGSGRRAPTVAYLGWFGPRGIASIILALIVISKFELAHQELIVLIMTITVGASIYLHGLTAWPGANRYADWYERNADASEAHDVGEQTD